MATTTNYSWTTPDDTDLVKDGAAAIRTLGSSADTTVKALNPGTTAGDIDYYTAATTKARIGIGTAGQVLQVNSGATAPEWATPSSGGMTLLQTLSLSGTSTTSSSIAGTFNSLQIIVRNFRAASDKALEMRFNSDSGTSYRNNFSFGNNTALAANVNIMQISGDQDSAVSNGYQIIHIRDYANAVTYKQAQVFSITTNGTTTTQMNAFSNNPFWYNTSAITTVTFLADGASFSAGSALIYGVK